jgi:hypothetical protein
LVRCEVALVQAEAIVRVAAAAVHSVGLAEAAAPAEAAAVGVAGRPVSFSR